MRTCCMNVSDPLTGWRPCWALLPRRRSRMPGNCSRSPAWRSSRTGLSGRGYRPRGWRQPVMRHVSFMTPGRPRSGPRRTPARISPRHCWVKMRRAWRPVSALIITVWASSRGTTGRTRRPLPPSPGKGWPGTTRTGTCSSPLRGSKPRTRCGPLRGRTRRSWEPITRAGRRTGTGSAARSPVRPLLSAPPAGRT